MSSHSGWSLSGLSLGCFGNSVVGDWKSLFNLTSKMQVPAWIGDAFVICFLLGGAIVLISEVSVAVPKVLLSCDFKSGCKLAGAVTNADTHCVDYWLQQEPLVVGGGDQPLLYMAVETDNALVLSRHLATSQFDLAVGLEPGQPSKPLGAQVLQMVQAAIPTVTQRGGGSPAAGCARL